MYNCICTCVAFSGDVEVSALVLWELLEPPLQEHHVVRGFIGSDVQWGGRKVRRAHHHAQSQALLVCYRPNKKQSVPSFFPHVTFVTSTFFFNKNIVAFLTLANTWRERLELLMQHITSVPQKRHICKDEMSNT